MDRILDKDYINELKILKIGPEGSGFLSVDQEAWIAELFRLERRGNMGCYAIFLILFLMIIIPVPGRLYIILIGSYLGIQYKVFNSRRYKNLRKHSSYQYEIFEDKIVRYSDRNYLIFEKTEIKEIRKKAFGIVLYKSKDINSYFLNSSNTNLIIIPNKLQCFKQIEKQMIDSQ